MNKNRSLRRWLTGWFTKKTARFGRKVVRAGRRCGVESLEGRDLMAVTYHGGALLANVEAQAVYLGSDWTSNATLNAQTKSIDNYLSYLTNSPYMDMLTQAGYNVGRGSATAGVIGQDVSKTNGVTDTQIHNDLQALITTGKVAAPTKNRLYVVYVEPGVVVKDGADTSANAFLGYHGAFAGKDAAGKAVDIRYAIMAYPGGPNPSASSQGFGSAFDQLTAVTSHEVAEAVTDPDVNYKAIGWYDDRLNGEIGDLTDKTERLNGYLVQDVVNKNDVVISPPKVVGPVTAPLNVKGTATSSSAIQLQWTGVSGADGYRIYRVDGSARTLVASAASGATSATVTGLSADTAYSLVVEAYNSSSAAAAAAVSVKTLAATPLAAPSVTATATSPSSAQVKWGTVANATGYRLYRVDGNQATLVTTLGSTVVSYSVTGLTAGSTVSFRVQAYNSSSSADSAVVSVTLPQVPPTTSLDAPTVTAKAQSATSALLSWNTVAGAQGYRIFYLDGTTLVSLGRVAASTTAVKVVGLNAGETISFVVEAYNANSVADSAAISVTTPDSPGWWWWPYRSRT